MAKNALFGALYVFVFGAGIYLFNQSYPKVDCNEEMVGRLRSMSELERTHFFNQNKFRCI